MRGPISIKGPISGKNNVRKKKRAPFRIFFDVRKKWVAHFDERPHFGKKSDVRKKWGPISMKGPISEKIWCQKKIRGPFRWRAPFRKSRRCAKIVWSYLQRDRKNIVFGSFYPWKTMFGKFKKRIQNIAIILLSEVWCSSCVVWCCEEMSKPNTTFRKQRESNCIYSKWQLESKTCNNFVVRSRSNEVRLALFGVVRKISKQNTMFRRQLESNCIYSKWQLESKMLQWFCCPKSTQRSSSCVVWCCEKDVETKHDVQKATGIQLLLQ